MTQDGNTRRQAHFFCQEKHCSSLLQQRRHHSQMMFSVASPSPTAAGGPTAQTPSGGHPPTAVQFYADPCHVDFRSLTATAAGGGVGNNSAVDAAASGAVVSPAKQKRGGADAQRLRAILPHADLSYHSVSVPSENDDEEDDDDRVMGVWNCRVAFVAADGDGSGEDGGGRSARLTEMLLDRVILAPDRTPSSFSSEEEKKEEVKGGGSAADDTKASRRRRRCAFVVTVDLGRPSEVVPTIRSVIGSIVRHLENEDDKGDDDDDVGAGATTTLEALGATTFGSAPPPVGEEGVGEGAGADRKGTRKIALVLACLVPPVPPATYRDKQAQALVTYHLHRYACAVDCTLAFVRRGGGPEEEGATTGGAGAGATIDVPTLCRCVHRVAMGLPPTEEADTTTSGDDDDDAKEGEGGAAAAVAEDDDVAAASSTKAAATGAGGMALVGPGHHDRAAIESTLRRNANCEGQWDVDKDSLAVALPPPTRQSGGASTALAPPQQPSGGEWDDEAWMGRLASTVKVGTVGAPAASASSSAAGGAAAGKKAAAAGKKKKAAAEAGTAASGASDAASFFENLLKK